MIDPLSIIFIPGGLSFGLAVFAGPLVVLRHIQWRRRAHKLNAEARCGRCGHFLAIDSLFLYSGTHVCRRCADTLRTRLKFLLPATVTASILFAISSGAALLVSSLHGGPGLAWWLDGRWIPLLMPSVGVALCAAAAVEFGKRMNQLKNAATREELNAGDHRFDELSTLEDSRSTEPDLA